MEEYIIEEPITNEMAFELYNEYKATRTQEDIELSDIVMEYEELFDDMCMEQTSIVHDFVTYEEEQEDGTFVEYSNDKFLDLLSQKWRFYVRDLGDDNVCGITYIFERKIEINKSERESIPTIIHEMIHAHESIIDNMLPFFHDIMTLCLYKELVTKIPDLDERILMHSHEHFGTEITYQGGNHDILFFLKSLDLDLRLGYKLGTVCGYGREEFVAQAE